MTEPVASAEFVSYIIYISSLFNLNSFSDFDKNLFFAGDFTFYC